MTREELKKIVFKTHSPLTVEEVMFCIDKYVEQKRADAIDEYFEIIKKHEDMLGCVMICQCESIAEQLKKHNEQNSIIEALKPRECADMPKEIICNCTKEVECD